MSGDPWWVFNHQEFDITRSLGGPPTTQSCVQRDVGLSKDSRSWIIKTSPRTLTRKDWSRVHYDYTDESTGVNLFVNGFGRWRWTQTSRRPPKENLERCKKNIHQPVIKQGKKVVSQNPRKSGVSTKRSVRSYVYFDEIDHNKRCGRTSDILKSNIKPF